MLKPLIFNIKDCRFYMLPVEGTAEGMPFDMGDEHGDLWVACGPVHPVSVSSFHIAEYPVTQALWNAVTDYTDTPSFRFAGPDRPAERVSWDDIRNPDTFLDRLNDLTEKQRPPGTIFRLPTEAEWEYAARGGKYCLNGKYAGSNKIEEVAFYAENSHDEAKPAGMKFPNELGLYDMSGNVDEWCEDDWHYSYKENAPKDGSAWIDTENRGDGRVFRGGSWAYDPQDCRVAYRNHWYPGYRDRYLGFRVALAPSSKESPSGSL